MRRQRRRLASVRLIIWLAKLFSLGVITLPTGIFIDLGWIRIDFIWNN